ncbi:MAG: YhfC family intrarane metalloprotease [Clostridiaceae bacterium]|nr:YhfC family intrarane metalloprotease [Clostridiaceae bacterium]
MASNLSIFYVVIGMIISMFLPTVLAIFMIKRYKASWKAFLVGAVVFVISQPLLRLQILRYLNTTVWFTLFTTNNFAAYSIILGITAGLFEEFGRYIGFKFFLKDKLQWKNGIVFGLGHGGIEALIFVGLGYITLLANRSLITAAPNLYLAGSLERVMAVICHIAMTLLVLYAVKYSRKIYLFYAILFHSLIDSPLGLLKLAGFTTWAIEGYIFILTIAALFIIIKLKNKINNDNIMQRF